MFRLLIKFWPMAIPVILYFIWFFWTRRRANKQGDTIPKFLSGPWWWTLAATLLIGIAMFIGLGLSEQHTSGQYTPAHIENGVIIPGKTSP